MDVSRGLILLQIAKLNNIMHLTTMRMYVYIPEARQQFLDGCNGNARWKIESKWYNNEEMQGAKMQKIT